MDGSCTENLPPLIHSPSLVDSTGHRVKEMPVGPRGINVMKISHKLSTIMVVVQRTYLFQDALRLKGHRWKAKHTGPRGMLHTM